MTVVGQILLLCACVAVVMSQPYFGSHRQNLLNDDSLMKNLNNIINSNMELSNSILKDIAQHNKAFLGTYDVNNLGRSDIFDDIEFKPPGFYGNKIFKPDWVPQGDQGETFRQDNEHTVSVPFETNSQSQKIGDKYNDMKIKVKKGEKNVLPELNPSGNTDQIEPTQNIAEPKNHLQNSNIKVPSQLNGVKVMENSQKIFLKEINLSKGRNDDEKDHTYSDLANKLPQEFKNFNERNDDPNPEVNVKFDSDAIIKAILMIDPEMNDNETDPKLDKHKEPISLSNTKNGNNFDDRNGQADKTQTLNVPNRFRDDDTQYLYVVNTVPAVTQSNNSPSIVSNPTFAGTNNVINNQPQPSNVQTFLPSQTNFQNTNGQNHYTNYQPINPNTQMPVNNVMANENNLPSSNVVMQYPNNVIPNGYTSAPANGNSGINNQIPIYVTNGIPVQTANGGYLQVINSPRQYYMVQLGNGQTILVPVNSGQTSVSNNGQLNVVPRNDVQANVQNKGQYQYVPVNKQNLVQVPVNGRLPNNVQVVQMPSNGQDVYSVMKPNVPQSNSGTYTNPVKMMQVRPSNNNLTPMVMS